MAIISGLLGGLLASVVGYFITQLTEVKSKQRKACKNDILQGIENEMLEWEDLEILAQRWKQNRTDIHWILSDLLHESLTEKDDKGKQLYTKVKELLKTEQKTEPFAELPESIRIHVENVSSRFREDGDDVLRPLAASICDSIVESDKKSESQRKLTTWSFFVGIISLFIGILSLMFAISVMTPTEREESKTMPNQELQPTVTTPVESDKVQGTAAEL